MMRAPHKGAPLSTTSGNAMPPHDQQNGVSRPILPTLSASTKTVKTPLTPRLAGPSPSFASSPSTRRAARQDGNTTPICSQDEFSTPLSQFLNANITPRSSSRRTRVDSTNTTPTHTPTGTPVPDVLRIAHSGTSYGGGGGSNINGLQSDAPKRPIVSFNPAVSDLESQRDHSQSGSDMKFFYASDAKAAIQSKQQLPVQENKNSSFFYINSDNIPSPISYAGSAVESGVGSIVEQDRIQPKFFHANGTPDLTSQPAQHFSAASSNVSNSQFTAPRLGVRSPTKAQSPLQRPPSPLKANQSVPTSQIKLGSAVPSPIITRSNVVQDLPPVKSRGAEKERRKSGHERSASAGVLEDSSHSVRRVSNPVAMALSSPSFSMNLATASLVPTAEVLLLDLRNNGVSSFSNIPSPVKAAHSLERMNELAANARRERKVLDLEITNSSLAAINRTLEREMRKQTAELRRYRRLSRSGRLSINASVSVRTSSGTFSVSDSILLPDMGGESDIDEEEEAEEEESFDEGSLSPEAIAENDARHREKDERRLLLDLSKHQQLLIDSQNMNQSLKRCLGWTEELIIEGKKALAYNVRVSDIELGGRVLASDEVEDMCYESLPELDICTVNQFAAETTISRDLEAEENEASSEEVSFHPVEDSVATTESLYQDQA